MTFDEFTRTALPPLLRFAKVLCGSRALAEDVVQEVVVRAYGRWDRLQELDHPEAYVRRMIVNEYLSWRRKWARVIPHADVPEPAAAPDPATALAEREELGAGLARLPRQQRAVIVLRYYGGLTDQEVALELGCAASTVRAHASRALSALRIDLRSVSAVAKEA